MLELVKSNIISQTKMTFSGSVKGETPKVHSR